MGQFAIITGGTSGIGRHLVDAFVKDGYKVALSHYGSAEEGAAVVADVEAGGGQAFAAKADVGQGGDVEAFFDAACAWAGSAPDVLVNNAGIQTWSSLLDLTEEQWSGVLRTNLTGAFLNTKEAARRMIADGKGGAIINIGSGCNKLAFPKLVDYTASKGGVEQFTKVAAVELGPHGIRVNCVAPGAIITERTLVEAPDYEETWSKVTPLRRAGHPQDIAGPVLFLVSEAAGFVTGQTLTVDGGVFSQATWPYGV